MKKINQIKIMTGVYWVEIPEVEIYILCGCPPDIVKHLIRRGMIYTKEKNGVSYEAGPNAILLSDILLQNGQFSNMAEFPVLQMLYRQGMIIPNHPNNNGTKPLLIGAKDQVNSQMDYIYRGNYGFTSLEEIISAGAPEELAREIEQVKLKFSFGQIKPSKDFIDTMYIESEFKEVRNGVTARRIGTNIFEINYKDETISVDLNLPTYEEYESPYTLNFHLIKRSYFSIIHLGEGDGWDPKNPCMSSILMFHGKIYLIDAGPNITDSLNALGISTNEIEGIFHTHSHDDHFAGLPALIRADRRIKYFATPLVRTSVTKKLSTLLHFDADIFAKYFDVRDLTFDIWNNIEGLEVKPFFSPHPVENNIFIFRTLWENSYRSYAHLADIASLKILKNMIRKDPSLPGISQEFYDQTKENYLMPTDIKKLDIGGGLIHGDTEDFRDDKSGKIFLSHTSRPLTSKQKEIGSGAPFGMVDKLIPSPRDYTLQIAFRFLRAYFPDAPHYQLDTLLNSEVIEYNPQSIIMKEGELIDKVLLVLTGDVEVIHSSNTHNLFSPGALLGGMACLNNTPSTHTFRSTSFLHALSINKNLYKHFILENNLYEELNHTQSIQDALIGTWLFGEGISHTIYTKIAKVIRTSNYPAGKQLTELDENMLHIVKQGRLERYCGKVTFESLEEGDFLGEEIAIFEVPQILSIRTLEPTCLYELPKEILNNIPIALWKLQETHEKRKCFLSNVELGDPPDFQWKDEYGISIAEIDDNYMDLFMKTAELQNIFTNGKHPKELIDTLNSLIDQTKLHFIAEENLLEKHRYPHLGHHCKTHQVLIEQIQELKTKLDKDSFTKGFNFIEFFKGWLFSHIMNEDRQYSIFLQKMGCEKTQKTCAK